MACLLAVVLATLLTVVGAERGQAPPSGQPHGRQQQDLEKLKKACVNYCRPFKDQCMKALCERLEAENRDKYWWCIGGCIEHSGMCLQVCVDQSGGKKKKN